MPADERAPPLLPLREHSPHGTGPALRSARSGLTRNPRTIAFMFSSAQAWPSLRRRSATPCRRGASRTQQANGRASDRRPLPLRRQTGSAARTAPVGSPGSLEAKGLRIPTLPMDHWRSGCEETIPCRQPERSFASASRSQGQLGDGAV